MVYGSCFVFHGSWLIFDGSWFRINGFVFMVLIEFHIFTDLQPLLPPSDAESAKYDELLNSLRNLEAKVREIESVNTCTICLDRQRNIMFLCGHGTCDICSPSLEVCPICRDPIEKKIAMF